MLRTFASWSIARTWLDAIASIYLRQRDTPFCGMSGSRAFYDGGELRTVRQGNRFTIHTPRGTQKGNWFAIFHNQNCLFADALGVIGKWLGGFCNFNCFHERSAGSPAI